MLIKCLIERGYNKSERRKLNNNKDSDNLKILDVLRRVNRKFIIILKKNKYEINFY